ncbi:hypothetical protein FHS14_005874 [Paenibacillus baekrokdamisoli]|uniref:hypothetical protein n=1 Tax=Paenibacillus baekrokdamisoli TaxID=1712516 RepID=UPI00184D63A1|nr:hypothetical protein [Paenibacillus baekrokdamisoli]MBB3072838.1 hypothetical protein [Paenibacillus baekrokdamisoli]
MNAGSMALIGDEPDRGLRRHALFRNFQDHLTYNLDLLYFLCNDKRIPEVIRNEARQWGLPADEYTDFGGWSPQLTSAKRGE